MIISSKFHRNLTRVDRGVDTIVTFDIDPQSGKLTGPTSEVDSRGSMPRGMTIDPSGKWLVVANQKGDNVVLFDISGKTPEFVSEVTVKTPVDVVFVPDE